MTDLSTIHALAIECGAVSPSLDVQQQQTRIVARVLTDGERFRQHFVQEEGADEAEARSRLKTKLVAMLRERQEQLRAKSSDVAAYARRAELLGDLK